MHWCRDDITTHLCSKRGVQEPANALAKIACVFTDSCSIKYFGENCLQKSGEALSEVFEMVSTWRTFLVLAALIAEVCVTMAATDSAPASSAPLLLMGRQFPFHFSTGDFSIGGKSIVVHEEYNAGKGTGLTVWDGAIVLAKWLETLQDAWFSHTYLELGCGTGVVGLAARAMGAPSVILSDLPYALENTEKTVEANGHLDAAAITLQPIDWFDPIALPSAGVILAADVVWVEELIAPLISTLEAATAPKLDQPILLNSLAPWIPVESTEHAVVLLSYQSRSTRADHMLFTGLDEAFEVFHVQDSDMPDAYNPRNINVYVLVRR